jgi:molybdopterin-binding protein
MAISARNQLKGTVKSVRTDGLMAEIVVDVGGQEVVSVITRSSAEALRLASGDAVTVVIKSSEVMISK